MPESRALELIEPLLALDLDTALRVARAAWRQLSIEEQAAIAADWPFWLRAKQRPPPGRWRSWGFLTGRGLGKTVGLSWYVNEEVKAGSVKLIGLCAQDEQSSKDIQINGASGLIATAPPDNKPEWLASEMQLAWPNGARAYVRTPEVPGKIRGLDYHLFWASELQSWPVATREEAWSNIELSTRLGGARILWDSTSKRRHPVLKARLKESEENPRRFVVVRGTTHENAANLADDYVEDLQRKYGGTQRGREELLGEMLEDAEGALFKQVWIDEQRRHAPSKFTRKAVSIDPAVSNRKGSDTTGLVEVGLGVDDRGYVLRDKSGQHDPATWGTIALDWYVDDRCDLIMAETNKGGALVVQNLRSLAHERGLEVIVVERDKRPTWTPGKVFVKEVYARGAKEDRAEPVATAYERKRVSHVLGADLSSLEDTLTTWEPAPNADSPGDLDALVHGLVELLNLTSNEPDPKRAFEGIVEVSKEISKSAPITSLAQVFTSAFGSGRGDRI